MRNQKGITLIALVITIIVLLILAGVSIAMLTGDNGILTQASRSKRETNTAEVLERVNMELNAQMANVMAGDDFDSADEITANIGTLPDGYKAEVIITPADADAGTKASVSIKVKTVPDGVELDPATGTVSHNGTMWTVTAVKAK